MERKTHFETEEDVEAYFAAQDELWHEPRPQPAPYLWERIEQARLLNVRLLVKAFHPLATPNFSRLEFPAVSKERRTYRIRPIHKIAEVPRMRASPQKRYKLKKISSLRDLLFTRRHET